MEAAEPERDKRDHKGGKWNENGTEFVFLLNLNKFVFGLHMVREMDSKDVRGANGKLQGKRQ